MSRLSIGIFDSGVGGLSVMKAIGSLLPHENIVYLGDTAHFPYGNKSSDTILKYSIDNAQFLLSSGVKVLVVACNTACSIFAVEELRKISPVPVLGIIDPVIAKIVGGMPGSRIGILGTKMTIAKGVHRERILTYLPSAQVTAVACPLLASLVEEGYLEHPLTERALQEYLGPLKEAHIDLLLLGCTHYSMLQLSIQKQLGSCVEVIDPAIQCAEALKDLLQKEGLLNLTQDPSHYRFFVSEDPEKFCQIGNRILGDLIKQVSCL